MEILFIIFYINKYFRYFFLPDLQVTLNITFYIKHLSKSIFDNVILINVLVIKKHLSSRFLWKTKFQREIKYMPTKLEWPKILHKIPSTLKNPSVSVCWLAYLWFEFEFELHQIFNNWTHFSLISWNNSWMETRLSGISKRAEKPTNRIQNCLPVKL